MLPLFGEINSVFAPAASSACRTSASSDCSTPSVARIATRLPFSGVVVMRRRTGSPVPPLSIAHVILVENRFQRIQGQRSHRSAIACDSGRLEQAVVDGFFRRFPRRLEEPGHLFVG